MKTPQIYISGISTKNLDNMAGTIANAIDKNTDMILWNVAFVGKSEPAENTQIGNTYLNLIKPNQIKELLNYSQPDAIVDYAPWSENWKFYNQLKIPFILWATKVDIESIIKDTKKKENYWIIASNMGEPIVMLKHKLESIDSKYFQWLSMKVIESHQAGKADYSGTVKNEIGRVFQEKWVQFEVKNENLYTPNKDSELWDLNCIREKETQEIFGIPEEYITWHAYHIYELKWDIKKLEYIQEQLAEWSKLWNQDFWTETSVKIMSWKLFIEHNINGREIYAQWTIEAIKYILHMKKELSNQYIHSMVDVFKKK
jgi:4-hydroxy-tetrahydrodipicolinate reductase